MIQPSFDQDGQPFEASMAPVSAKGRAKTECSHLIISRVMRMLRSISTGYREFRV